MINLTYLGLKEVYGPSPPPFTIDRKAESIYFFGVKVDYPSIKIDINNIFKDN